MKNRLQQIKEDSYNISREISSDLRNSQERLCQIGNEYHRVTELSGQAALVVDQIDRDFKSRTKLTDCDLIILFLATAAQCVRQYLLSGGKLRITATQGDQLVKNALRTKIGDWQPVPPDHVKLLTQSVPYDAVNFSSPEIKTILGNQGLSGSTHRYRTLGHDPVLGWIFGTANIMTSSLTKSDFQTLYVTDKKLLCHYPGSTVAMFSDAAQFAQQDELLLPTAVARQAIHYGTDYFTKQGLPVPLVASVNNDLAARMVRDWHMDMWNITRNAAVAALINQLVTVIHQLFYDERKDGEATLYEVRTRKILSYSNLLATGSNIIVAAMTGDAAKLDVGGLLVTISRIASDYQFIHEIKKDFLKNELDRKIIGSEYDFMKGAV